MDQLKDVILSTLAEIQETPPLKEEEAKIEKSSKGSRKKEPVLQAPKEYSLQEESSQTMQKHVSSNEELFLNSLRERLLVLFEGFQAPNNTAVEAKLDLTLNFLEYVLASIDERLEQLKDR